MIVQIDKSVYEMSCEIFDKIVELILEKILQDTLYIV